MNVAPFIIRYNYPIEVVLFGSAGDVERAEATILG